MKTAIRIIIIISLLADLPITLLYILLHAAYGGDGWFLLAGLATVILIVASIVTIFLRPGSIATRLLRCIIPLAGILSVLTLSRALPNGLLSSQLVTIWGFTFCIVFILLNRIVAEQVAASDPSPSTTPQPDREKPPLD